MTDFENAALTVFLALMTRVIITYGLDLAIPISQVNENMNAAHHRDSARQEKFYFRTGSEISQLNLNEIINGTKDFLGLVPLVRQYLNEREDIDANTKVTIDQYLSLVSKRAAGRFSNHIQLMFIFVFQGTLLTNASWVRQFVISHPLYKQDSVVSEEIQYDLVQKIKQFENGEETCPHIVHPKMETATDLYPIV